MQLSAKDRAVRKRASHFLVILRIITFEGAPVLHVAFIGRRARFPTAVPAAMLFYFGDNVKDLLVIFVTIQAKEQTSKLIF